MLLNYILIVALASGPLSLQEQDGKPEGPRIQDCLNCHGQPEIAGLSPTSPGGLRALVINKEGLPLKSEDPAFRARLYVKPDAYLQSAHRELLCVECHRDVRFRPAENLFVHEVRRESVDCAGCHKQQVDEHRRSRHFAPPAQEGRELPDCYGCHGGYHDMLLKENPASPVSLNRRVSTCGGCHEDRLATYRETYHGIFELMGHKETARCVSCHENHLILRASDEGSAVHPDRLAGTCGTCHEGAGPNLVAFRGHLDPRGDASQPVLYYAAWFMRLLLIGVLGFFGLHSLLWLFRSIPDLAWRLKGAKDAPGGHRNRFRPIHRWVHLLIIVSFFGLAVTGLPLAFAETLPARKAIQVMGGLDATRMVHRACAVLTLVYAVLHLGFLWRLYRGQKGAARTNLFFGPDSLVPRWKDFRDLKDHVRWFFGAGPRPAFGRWTYMEKFDYWAVFWGVVTIGLSGLVLWFPMFFTAFLPGWVINLSKIVHSEESLLAVGYIFAIHFFNVHLRPLKFPMDPVMFTGRETLAHVALERGGEWEGMSGGQRAAHGGNGPDGSAPGEGVLNGTAPGGNGPDGSAPGSAWTLAAYLFGLAALVLGLALLAAAVAGILST